MRAEVFGLAIATALLFHGSTPELNGALTREQVTVPAWLSIPPNVNVAAIDYTGGPGDEYTRGRIRVLTDGNAPELVGTMLTHLALDGFVIAEKHFDNVMSSRVKAMITANNPQTGQSATVAYLAGLTSEELQINFAETAAQ